MERIVTKIVNFTGIKFIVDFDNSDDEKKVKNKLSFMLYFCYFQATVQLKFGQKHLTDYAQRQL